MLRSTRRPSSDRRFASPIQRQFCQPPAFRVLAKATLAVAAAFAASGHGNSTSSHPCSHFPRRLSAIFRAYQNAGMFSIVEDRGGWGGAAVRSNDRCGARTRSGQPCQREALKNGRCAYHGGLSTGPRTREGRARIAAAARKRWRDWRWRQAGKPAGLND
jgi:hypothetical protein